jgi:hypothetical protein
MTIETLSVGSDAWARDVRAQNHRSDDTHLYVVYNRATLHAKIGRAQDVDRRLAQLQTGSPVALEVVLEVPFAGWTEPVLHTAFVAYRTEGEWFRSAGPVIRFVEQMWSRRAWRLDRGEEIGATDVLACVAYALDPTLVAYVPENGL